MSGLRMLAIASALIVTLPASAQSPAPGAPDAAGPSSAPGAEGAPLVTKSGTIGQAPAGKAQLVFWRPGTLVGAALGCTVHEGTREVARLGAGKYWVETVEPGKHVYFTEGEAKDTLPMEAEDGETYFVRCSQGIGVVAARPLISPSNREEFAKRAKGMTLWAKKPAA